MRDIYDDIRPFTDAEAAEALPVLAKSKMVGVAGRYFFADKPEDYLPKLIAGCRSVDEFQAAVISTVLERDLALTQSSFTYSGLENYRKGDGTPGAYVLLSTHRDIVLDPAFVELALFKEGLPESEIAAGDNLLANSEIEIAMRANRMIKVVRSDNPRVVYTTSKVLSAYIRGRIVDGERSVWIAHRGGRTKNGCDRTEQGLLKMLAMSGTGTFAENFAQLRIMPVTISYEYETCGALKVLELLTRARQGFYHKKPGEDVNSMLQGFLQPKGRIHVDFCKPLTAEELLRADSAQHNEKFRILSEILDERLLASFKLWPTNYAAADILAGNGAYLEQGFYTAEDRERLIARLKHETEGMPSEVYTGLLELYAAHLNKK
jgi:hypothetical protein